MVVAYPANQLQRSVYRLLAVSPYFSLINLFAGRELVPELLFEPGDGAAIARLATPLLDDQRASELAEELKRIRAEKFHPGASQKAARQILTLLEEHSVR